MGKTLFVTDLDGTLLSAGSRVTESSVDMLNEAIADGALFSIATARTPSTVAHLMRDIKATLPYIVMTGSALWNPQTGEFSDAITMEPPTAHAVLDIIRRHSLPAFAYQLRKDKIHIYHTGPLSDIERKFISERDRSKYKVFHIPEDGDSEIPDPPADISLFYAMQPSALVESTYKDIKESIDCNPVFYHDMFGPQTGILEVFSPQASKANAIRKLKALTGACRVVAFGDNVNDLPMFREADLAVAVENAVDEVKAAADIIIPANTTDSVAKYILWASTSDNAQAN